MGVTHSEPKRSACDLSICRIMTKGRTSVGSTSGPDGQCRSMALWYKNPVCFSPMMAFGSFSCCSAFSGGSKRFLIDSVSNVGEGEWIV
jgi:hypothetical protein